MKRPIFLLLALGLSLSGNGRVRLPSLVGSGMVLQRNSDARIWGRAEPGRRVTVTPSWGAEPAAVRADGSGRWSVRIETPDAGGPHTLTIDDGDPLVLDDILIGEVWLCSGQSNMEMPLRGFDSQPVNGSLETAMLAGEHPEIRLFRVSRAVSHEPQEDCTGTWQVSSMRSASGFSAVGYHFGLCLARALGIPIGLIESDWGATRIEAWMSREAARNVRHDILATDAEHDPQNRTGALYNAMIRPLTPYTLRGFVWYQGESNKGCHADYARNMAAMVAEWRDAWGGGERMPFYYVQLAPFDYDIPMHRFRGERNPVLLPLLVEAQLRALELIPNADMAVNTDLGDAREIHPPGKRIVGQRLALLALAGTAIRKRFVRRGTGRGDLPQRIDPASRGRSARRIRNRRIRPRIPSGRSAGAALRIRLQPAGRSPLRRRAGTRRRPLRVPQCRRRRQSHEHRRASRIPVPYGRLGRCGSGPNFRKDMHTPIKLREKIGYGLGDAASSMFWKLFGSYLLFFYTDVFGLPAAAAGTMFLVTRLWDSFVDPVVGVLADRTRSRRGKFRPYLFRFAVPFGIAGILTFTTPGFGPTGKLVYAYVSYGAMMMVYSAVNVPYASLLGVISDNPRTRTELSSYRMLFAFGGSLLALLLIEPLVGWFSRGSTPQTGWQAAVATLAVVATAFLFCTYAWTRERVRPVRTERTPLRDDLKDLMRNRPWWILLGAGIAALIFNSIRDGAAVYYFKYYVQTEQTFGPDGTAISLTTLFLVLGQAANIAGILLVTPVSNRVGKKNAYLGAMAAATVLSLAFWLPGSGDVWAMMLLQVLISMCAGSIFPLLWSMYADIADYSELRTGRRATGLIFSSSSMSQKFGWTLGGALTGWLLGHYGFEANAMQEAAVQNGIRAMMSLLPAAGTVLSVLFIACYPLGERRVAEIGRKLAELRARSGGGGE